MGLKTKNKGNEAKKENIYNRSKIMEENIKLLFKRFEEIKKMGYIKGVNNSLAAMGMTLEKMMGANAGGFQIPDFYGIELKTRRSYSQSDITLFSATPDGIFQIERIKDRYGYADKDIKKAKVFKGNVYCNRYNSIGKKFLFKLDIDYKEERIYLEVYDKNLKLIDKESYWSFKDLEEILYRKLQYLALIDVWPSKRKGEMYYCYYRMRLFKLKDFERFISLINDGIISILINIGVYKTEKRYGQTYNHGCAFRINEKKLVFLFSRTG